MRRGVTAGNGGRARRAARPLRPLAALLLAAACASPDAEIHLAPIFSRHTVPGYDHTEAAGGILYYGQVGERVTWALRPLLWTRTYPNGAVNANFLYPLGKYEHDPKRPRTMVRLFPLFYREAETLPTGVEEIDWVFLPPFFWGGSSSDGTDDYFAFFPFFGKIRGFLSFEEINFVFWPIYFDNKKDERRSYHILWPIFGWTEGSERGWHVFPLYGEAEVPGSYRRSYVLWPIFQETEEELWKEHPRQGWLVVPLAGHITQDDYTSTTVLWPIFGWAERPSTGFTSWQVWPILKFTSEGARPDRVLKRIFPFYMHYEAEGIETRSYLWPLFWDRTITAQGKTTESFYAVPIWWASRSKSADGTVEDRWRAWPLVKSVSASDGTEWFRVFAPGIEPIINSYALSNNLGFVFEVWASQQDYPLGPREERAFLNLYHEAQSTGHTRWSLPVLGGVWTEPDGTEHYSFLLGLFRFESGPDESWNWEDPAFPGPGWPDLHDLPHDWEQPGRDPYR